MMAKVK